MLWFTHEVLHTYQIMLLAHPIAILPFSLSTELQFYSSLQQAKLMGSISQSPLGKRWSIGYKQKPLEASIKGDSFIETCTLLSLFLVFLTWNLDVIVGDTTAILGDKAALSLDAMV